MGSISKIKLTQGKYAIIDTADFEWLTKFKWQYTHGYARRTIYDYSNGWRNRKAKREYMHRLIMCEPPDKLIDHINGDSLDNRRSNLRIADKTINNFNSNRYVNSSSGHRGVYVKGKKFYSQIRKNNKKINLGTFSTLEEAIEAYQKAALLYYGFIK